MHKSILLLMATFASAVSAQELSNALPVEKVAQNTVVVPISTRTPADIQQEPLITSQVQSAAVSTPDAVKTAQVATTSVAKPSEYSYTGKTFTDDIKAIKWDALGTFAGITAIGVKSWKWGSADFHFKSEGWFGKESSSGGTDKLGHAFSSYTMTNLFAEHLQRKGRSPAQAALSAALLTQALMLYVETFDGFSTDHGFSKEDVIANLTGTGLAYLRQRYPAVKDLVDYRMEYSPSGYKGGFAGGFRPLSDYAGQKYMLVLKLSGIKPLKTTPLKYVELNAGYYARGFTDAERAEGKAQKRYGFVGVGLNLSELIFGERDAQETIWDQAGRNVFEHIQLPTYVRAIRSDL